jgi:hypothetical protein
VVVGDRDHLLATILGRRVLGLATISRKERYMGTEIYLTVGGVMVDWSKNRRGRDHGVLFQPQDRTRTPPDPDDAAEGSPDSPDAWRLARSLRSTVPRLELLGYTVETTKAEYEQVLDEWLSYREDDDGGPPARLEFDGFVEFIRRHPLAKLDDTLIQSFDDASKNKMQARFAKDPALGRIPQNDGSGDGYSEADYFGSLVRILDPYSVMRALALAPENLDTEVAWDYGPMVGSGWADEEEFAACARRQQTFLIATEGTTDIRILKRSIQLIMPEVEDFFCFIDVTERHPFSGTGNLVNFAQGLAAIDVHNQVVFLFDNDAEGWAAYEKVRRLRLPTNMRTSVLPDTEEFRDFECIGPHGVHRGDINRRAAAIECYLDLRLKNRPPPRVLWTNFRDKEGVYQGSLEHKETYMRSFLRQKPAAIAAGSYDVSKLRTILDHVFHECRVIAMATREATQDEW